MTQMRIAGQKISALSLVLHTDVTVQTHLIVKPTTAEHLFIISRQKLKTGLQFVSQCVIHMTVFAADVGLHMNIVEAVTVEIGVHITLHNVATGAEFGVSTCLSVD